MRRHSSDHEQRLVKARTNLSPYAQLSFLHASYSASYQCLRSQARGSLNLEP